METRFLLEIIENYGVAIIAVLLFLISLAINKNMIRSIGLQFLRATLFTAALVVADIGDDYYAMFSTPNPQRVFFAACGYTFRVLILYSIVDIYCRHLPKFKRVLIMAPAVINCIISFSAFFSQEVFYFNEVNEIVRGPLISIPFIASIVYGLVLAYEGLKRWRRGENKEIVLVICIFCCCIVTTLLEVKFRTSGILPGCGMASLLVYYMHFMSVTYSYDPLTDACMRSRLYEDTEGYYGPYGVIEMDLNNLKVINDTKGHLEGDKALVAICKITQSCLPDKATLYRMGGDEFVVIYKTGDELSLNKLVDKMRSAIFSSPYTAAIGCSMRVGNEVLEQVLARADAAMYQDKEKYKKNSGLSIR